MKLTLIKEDIQDKNIVDEVMETHLYENEKDKEAKEAEKEVDVINDEEVEDPEPESDAVQDILDPNETTGLDIPDEPLPLETEQPSELDSNIPFEETQVETNPNEAINTLNNIINGYWGLIDQLKYIKINDNMVKDESQKEAFIKITDSLIDDTTISIGMLYKLLQLCSPEVNVLIDKGINKADEKILGNNE